MNDRGQARAGFVEARAVLDPPTAHPNGQGLVGFGGKRPAAGPMAAGSQPAQPMQLAPSGEEGASQGNDYQSPRVPVASAALEGAGRELVVRPPVQELRQPYRVSGLWASGVGLVLGLVGAGGYLGQISPLRGRLRRQERNQAILLANLPGMVFRCRNDPHWTMEFVSCGVREMAGLRPEDLELSESMTYASLIHEEDRARVWEEVQQAVAEKSPYEVRYRLYDANGAIRHVWERGRPVYDPDRDPEEVHIEGFVTDVTQAMEATEAQARLAEIVESTSNMVGMADAGGRPLYINPAGRSMLGEASAPGGLRSSIEAYTPPDWIDFLNQTALPQAAEKGRWAGEIGLQRLDGSEIPVSGVIIGHRDSHGELAFYSAIYRDLSAQKAYESQLQAERDFNRAMTDYLPGLFYLIDEDHRFVRWNRNMELVLGMRGDAVRAQDPLGIIHDEDRPLIEQRMREVFQEGEATAEARLRPANKPPRPFHFEARRVDLDQKAYLLGFGTDITERKAQEAKINRLSFRDSLTGLANRAYLLERLQEEIARALRHRAMGGLIFLDIDDFKPVNDSLGHPTGDQVLQTLAERISQQVRQEDILARIGGDEFVVLLPELGETVEEASLGVQEVAERLGSAMAEPIATGEIHLHLNISQGIALFPEEDGEEGHEVMRRADAAMYEAKQGGKGTIRFYRPEIQTALHKRLTLEQDLHRAFAEGELALHYQPFVELADGRLSGAEALLRWFHPERGPISPGEFIPVAEQSGFVVPLGKWVLHRALEQGKAWSETGRLPVGWHLSVNVSPRQFAQPDFVDQVQTALEATGYPGSMLQLEITETILWEDPSVPEKMTALNGMGVRFAVDDFGTGYSSLANLKRLPVDALKIDKSFIQDLGWDSQSRSITEASLLMASMLGLRTVAEGIEAPETANQVREWGCTAAQGFLYGAPMASEDFARLLGQ